MPDQKNTWVLAGIVVLALGAAALYYFAFYKTPEPQYRSFEFLSGVVIEKDDARRTVLVAASEDQAVPAGTRKTFLIADNATLQTIVLPDISKPDGTEATFEDAELADIRVGNRIIVQGSFSENPAEEGVVRAASVLTNNDVWNRQQIANEDEPLIITGSSDVYSALYGTILRIGPGRELAIRAADKQGIPIGSERRVLVPEDAVLQKMKRINSDGGTIAFAPIAFSELSVGDAVSVQADLETDIRKQASFNASYVDVMLESF